MSGNAVGSVAAKQIYYQAMRGIFGGCVVGYVWKVVVSDANQRDLDLYYRKRADRLKKERAALLA